MTNEAVYIQVLRNILNTLVKHPEAITIEEKHDEMGTLVMARVHKDDMGVVIGRNGVMATSIKTIIKAVGRSNEKNVKVQFLEPVGAEESRAYENQDALNGDLEEFSIN